MQQPEPTSRRLWKIFGGVQLPDEKGLSNGKPVAEAPVPELLILPLQQHIGTPAKPLVSVGDRVLKGQRIAEAQGYVSAPVHASSSGVVVAIERRAVPHPSGLSAPCIIIETDGRDAWGALPEPMVDFADRDPAQLRERIRWAGVVGMGGAAFPTSVKLNPDPAQPIRTLVLNGAECEPYITCDDMLMRLHAERVLTGAGILARLLGVEECLIGIESNMPEAIEAMCQALAHSEIRSMAQVVELPPVYPIGGEKQLIQALTGKEVPSNGVPAQIGILCQNVGTCAAVADAVLQGRPLISRLVTMSGRGFPEPGNFQVRIGTPVTELMRQVGGMTPDTRELVLGGPMMGFALQDPDVPVTKAANCLLALTEEESPDPGPALACIRCGACADVCPARLLPQQLYWYAKSKDLDRVQDYNLFDCIECGCCAQVCPSHIPLVQYYRYAKTESWAREQERRKADHARRRFEARQERIERQERERKAGLRKKRDALATKSGGAGVGSGPDGATATEDPRKAVIEAARKRAAAKKAALAEKGISPRNTRDLTPDQRRKIEAADARRGREGTPGDRASPGGREPEAHPPGNGR